MYEILGKSKPVALMRREAASLSSAMFILFLCFSENLRFFSSLIEFLFTSTRSSDILLHILLCGCWKIFTSVLQEFQLCMFLCFSVS